ncbi:hypothetical protein [Rosenbergiella nectarea]|uniref:hypothetical protein n=1 Tax=Rosenbergiella nectarea TaxID=988801 RepID=UPI001F4D50AD|nr:hypothetical protein [Rosenbergiella nectarea]
MGKVSLLGLILLMQLSSMSYASMKNTLECYVFINSSIPPQLALFLDFNEEYYLSPTLQNKGKVTFINISNQLVSNNYIIPIINDTQGIWVRKFKPHSLPTVFIIQGNKNLQRAIMTTAEIRQCLQGK